MDIDDGESLKGKLNYANEQTLNSFSEFHSTPRTYSEEMKITNVYVNTLDLSSA